ncbi:MAG: Coenzyme F420 hydrogenase/dehydrogenase, beta subunit C-terminal domain [Solirubrobacterales bacterium]
MEDKLTIEPVVREKLCTGCGTCAGVCPRSAIRMTVDPGKGCYLPRLDARQCTRCGLCHHVCPGHGVDFESLNGRLFGDVPEDVTLGRHLGCYIGHSLDRNTRYRCSSGGLVSALLVFALEERLIDGALVTRMRRDNPFRPESFIARTKEEILSAAGSKYCPVAAGTALNEILQREGRYAVVGLPCHIQGLRKAEHRLPALRERIRYRIGIPCSLNYSFFGTERVLHGLGIPPARVDAIQYRGRGRPGSMWIRLRNGVEQTVPLAAYQRQLAPYSLRRCTLCSDMLGELSDLTCGEARIPEVMRTDTAGSSFVVTRTDGAEELLEAAASNEAIELSELGVRELLASQSHALFKKRKLAARIEVFKHLGQSVPTYRQKMLTPMQTDYTDALKFYAARYALSGNRPIVGALVRLARSFRNAGHADQSETLAQATGHADSPSQGLAPRGTSE